MVPACGADYLLDKFGVSAGGADYLLVTSLIFMPIADYFLGISTAPTYEANNCWSSLTAPRVCFDCLLGAFTISAYGAVCSFGSFLTSTFGADYLLDKFAVCTCGAVFPLGMSMVSTGGADYLSDVSLAFRPSQLFLGNFMVSTFDPNRILGRFMALPCLSRLSLGQSRDLRVWHRLVLWTVSWLLTLVAACPLDQFVVPTCGADFILDTFGVSTGGADSSWELSRSPRMAPFAPSAVS